MTDPTDAVSASSAASGASSSGAPGLPVLDASQRAVLDLPAGASAAVLGAPGTGKTTALVALVADRVHLRGLAPEEVLALTSSRASATRLRDVLARAVARPTDGPLARSSASLAFEIAALARSARGEEPPRLITGAEQDADLAQLLAGHAEEGTGPAWPHPLTPEVRAVRAFRSELRELLARITDNGVSTSELRRWGADRGRPEWGAAADLFDEYAQVAAWTRPGQFDSSELARLAVDALDAGDVGGRAAALRLVVVDDMQEATASTLALLRALARRGVAVVAFGDPDVAANAFRGGEPEGIGRFGAVLGLPEAPTIVLGEVHRHGAAIRALVASTAGRIGAAGAGPQRAAAPAETLAPGGAAALARLEAPTPARQWTAVARVLRERHLMDGVPWSELCVVVRSGALVPEAARALTLAEVPTRVASGGRPLRDEPAARALLAVLSVASGRTPLTAETAAELLLGPFGGLDRLGVRRLRLALRAEELGAGGARPADELLVEALEGPGRLVTIDHRVARAAGRLAGTLGAARTLAERRAPVEEQLWSVWERSGLARAWREQALGTGVAAVEAGRRLDAVVALFAAARRFGERRPDAPAGIFLADVLDAEVPEDVLAPSTAAEAVLVATPSGTVGAEFDTVVVAGLQEGVWPNRRPRGSLLAPDEVVRIVRGVDGAALDERKLVLDDELRIFALAVSRARVRVVLAAVANDDESPSVLFGLLPPDAPRLDAGSVPLSLRAVTARLRRVAADPAEGAPARHAAAATLAGLAARRVAGADPAEWHGLAAPTTTAPLFEGERVPVSPSRLERFEESPLDWFVETVAGSAPTVSMSVGTIVHWAMETAVDPGVDALWAAVQSRFDELVFESPWLAEHQRRAARVLVAGVAEYLGDFARDGHRLVSAESRFSLEVGRAAVTGSIDRVERTADGAVVIVDLKTGTPIPDARIPTHAQLGAYQLAYRSGQLDGLLADLGDHAAGGARLLWVKKGSRGKSYRVSDQAPLDEAALEGFRERIRQAAVGMAAAEFRGTVELDSYGLGTVPRLQLHRVGAVSGD